MKGVFTALSADRFLLGDHREDTETVALRQEVTELFHSFREPIYRQCLRILGNPAEAEDVTQEVFIRLYSEIRAKRSVDYRRAWLFRSAHNLAIDRLRAARRQRSLDTLESEEPDCVVDDSEGTEKALLLKERHARVLASLTELSPQERRCMELRTEGLRYREIADILGVRTSTVETNLSRAVKKLMEKLNG